MVDTWRVGAHGLPPRSPLRLILKLVPFPPSAAFPFVAMLPPASRLSDALFLPSMPLASYVQLVERGTVSPSHSSSFLVGICAAAWYLQKALLAWRCGEETSDGGTGTFMG